MQMADEKMTTTQQTEETDSRQRILNVALNLFMTQGYAAVSTRQICAAAGVKQPSLYHHFGNKEGLYLAVVQNWFDSAHESIANAIQTRVTLREKLHGIAAIFWNTSLGDYQTMQRDALQNMPDEHMAILFKSIYTSVIAPVMQVMEWGIAHGDLPDYAEAYPLTQLFWAFISGIEGVYTRGDPFPAPADNISSIDFFLAGAKGLAPEVYKSWPVNERLNAIRFSK